MIQDKEITRQKGGISEPYKSVFWTHSHRWMFIFSYKQDIKKII